MAGKINAASIFDALLERLYSALARGPAINCHPGNSRQRVDLTSLSLLAGKEFSAQEILRSLLTEQGKWSVKPLFEQLPPKLKGEDEPEDSELARRRRENEDRRRLLQKLSHIANDADTFQKDTGNYVLYIGYPLVCIPPNPVGGRKQSNRIIAPLAFVPVGLTVSMGVRPSLTISCIEKGAERLVPNAALRIWIERQLGSPYPEDLFEDEEGADPAREVRELAEHLAHVLKTNDVPDFSGWPVQKVPNSSSLPEAPIIFPGAVLGLYQLRNQSIIRDMEELKVANALPETIEPLVSLNASLVADEDESYSSDGMGKTQLLPASEEHLIDRADPCQRRAVIRARNTKGLVVHGPPGTGKSQTITNMIGDYLARGKRVLLVCEKRTALDVVHHRLNARGLANLCAIVHDAQRDRIALYKGVREDLDSLAELPLPADVSKELARTNAEIERLDAELREFFEASATPDPVTSLTLHEMVGRWLQHGAAKPEDEEFANVDSEQLGTREGTVRGMYERLIAARYSENAWRGRMGVGLANFLSRDMTAINICLSNAVSAATRAAEVSEEGLLPFDPSRPLSEQADTYRRFADDLHKARTATDELLRSWLFTQPPEDQSDLKEYLDAIEPIQEAVRAQPLVPDLLLTLQATPWPADRVVAAIAKLATFLAKGQGFFSFLQFGSKKEARAVLAPLGLPLSIDNALKAKSFLEGVHARNQLRTFLSTKLPAHLQVAVSDSALLSRLDQLRAALVYLQNLKSMPTSVANCIRGILDSNSLIEKYVSALESSSSAAMGIQEVVDALQKMSLMNEEAQAALRHKLCHYKSIVDDVRKLADDVIHLESLLRFEEEAVQLPLVVVNALRTAALEEMDVDELWDTLLSGIYYQRSRALLAATPRMLALDAARVEGTFNRLADLRGLKRELEVRSIRRQWIERQKARLLSSTGTRLNPAGADLKRRLMMRGKNASRIREVIHGGLNKEAGDPLFEMRPVWMVSPSTAAQIFPLEPLFDAVIFDEASQCRLEEGLPVLARGRSVVIAGDTKQLPPTAFFQANVVSSTETIDAGDSEDELFQTQQAEIEDLLSAALNIEIEQAYLDVHYRSTSSELIKFSNESFYGSRLQAIPGHPNTRRLDPALQLHRVDGILDERCNQVEAETVVRLVKGLLRRDDPPSIGIVTFNLPQKDLIEELLDVAAEEDVGFRSQYIAARQRMGEGSFEGLFVKNLENVQGDERDYIIISTTFAPAPNGKFYRRFGPLAQAGGERRLNVIITRARHQVDLVTSIPPSIYRSDANATIPDGNRPNGAMFLMRYLTMAEQLQELREQEHEREALLDHGTTVQLDDDRVAEVTATVEPHLDRWPCQSPSSLADAFASRLLERKGVSTMLYYADDGFAVDLAIKERRDHRRVQIGVLMDAPRYNRAEDSVEWDAFRREILKAVGWEIRSIWTPQLLRDYEGVEFQIAKAAQMDEVDEIGGNPALAQN